MQQLKAAVIGCGGHAQGHFKMIADEPRLHLSAVAEVDPERLVRATAEHKPDESFRDYRDMLAKCDLDVVYVETMPGHLLPIVLACLEEGLNVSVEKSPGMSSEETETMAEAARRSKGKAIVSFNRRYFREVLAVRRLLQERGGAVHVGAVYNKPRTRLGAPAMAGIAPHPIICDAIHHVDLLRWLAGSSEEGAADAVEVYSEVQEGEQPGVHRHVASIRFDTGAVGSMSSHYGVGYRIQRAEAHAEDISFYLELTRARSVESYRASPPDDGGGNWAGQPIEEPLDLDSVGGPEFNETSHFVDCILADQTPWSNLDDAVSTMCLCEAIQSGHKGKL